MKRKISLIINGMFYGDSYTKKMLWSSFLLGVFSVTSLICAAAFFQWYFLAVALVFAGGDAFLIKSMNMGVAEVEEEEDDEAEEDEPEKELKPETPRSEVPKAEASKKKPAKKNEKPSKKEEPAKKMPGKSGTVNKEASSKKKSSQKAMGDSEDKSVKKEMQQPVVSEGYSDNELKQVLHKYKVKKNHRPILIDSSVKYKIKECPAYAWTSRGQFFLLLLEDEPRKISMGIEAVTRMRYIKDVPANQRKEYDCLVGQGLIPLVFNEYRPVYQSVIKNKRQAEVKNLYEIGGDIRITAPSAKEIMLLVQPEFIIEDDVMKSDEFNQYFKQIYKYKILLSDGVMSMKDYQVKIRGILEKMAEAPITPATFRQSLTEMVQRGLISSEYASFYTQYNRQYRERRR